MPALRLERIENALQDLLGMNEAGNRVDMEDDRWYSFQELAGILSITVLMTAILYFAIIHHPSVIARKVAIVIQRISLFSTTPAVSIYIVWEIMVSAIVKSFMTGTPCPEDVGLVCLFHCVADVYCFQTCGVLYGQCDARV